MWRVHDRLPAQRQEHPGEELPGAGRTGGRGWSIRSPRSPVSGALDERRLGGWPASAPELGCRVVPSGSSPRRAGGLRCRDVQHAAAAVPAPARPPCRRFLRGSATCCPDQLPGAARRVRCRSRLLRHTARVAITWSTGIRTITPTSSRCATARAATPWACSRPCSPTAGLAASTPGSLQFVLMLVCCPALARPAEVPRRLVGAGDHPAGHADYRDNSVTVRRRGRLGLDPAHVRARARAEPNPTWIPAANQVAAQLAENVDGIPGGAWSDLLNVPMTAHIIGGCADR